MNTLPTKKAIQDQKKRLLMIAEMERKEAFQFCAELLLDMYYQEVDYEADLEAHTMAIAAMELYCQLNSQPEEDCGNLRRQQ